MRRLTCKSTDSYNYESESLDFLYNGNLIFKQFNERLNRGGKTLVLYDLIAKEQIASSGSYLRGEKWWKKVSDKLSELGYNIYWKEIEDACKLREKENRDKKLTEVIHQQTLNNRELEKTEKKLIFLRKQIKENKSIIKVLQNYETNN